MSKIKLKRNKNSKVRNEFHFHIQQNTRGTVSKDKSKIIPRKQKYNRIDY